MVVVYILTDFDKLQVQFITARPMLGYITTLFYWLARPSYLSDWDVERLLRVCCDNTYPYFEDEQLLIRYGLQKGNAFEVLVERGTVTIEQLGKVINRNRTYGRCPDHVFRMLMAHSTDKQPDTIGWMCPITTYKAQLLVDTGYGLNGTTKDDRLLISWGKVQDVEMLNYLIELGWDVHAVRNYGNLLHVMSNETILRRLIELGVDLEVTDNDGLTPVQTNTSLFTILVPGSVDTMVIDGDGNSILQRYFLDGESSDIFKAALLLGVNVNHQNNRGETILHMLMDRIYNPYDPDEYYYYDETVMAEYLEISLAAGADPTLKTEPRSVEMEILKFKKELQEDDE